MRRSRGNALTRMVLQVVVVIGVGTLIALGANFLSPRGLDIHRNYFPAGAANTPVTPAVEGAPAAIPAIPIPVHEFSTVSTEELQAMTRDNRYVSRRFLVIDARNTKGFLSGHIQGALQFDHFQAENYLAEVLPACQMAEKIVIYCAGGSCEDSIFSARMLRDFGIPADRFAIYMGGIEEWNAAGLPTSAPAP